MIDKVTAGYISVSPIERQCENCVMFKTGSCDLVIGLIEPYAICAHWQPATSDAPAVGQVVMINESPRL